MKDVAASSFMSHIDALVFVKYLRQRDCEPAWLMAEKNDPLQSQKVYALVLKFAKL